jgi:NAD+ diphosphatase
MIYPRPHNHPKEPTIYMIVKGNTLLQSDGEAALPILSGDQASALWAASDYQAVIGAYQGRPVVLLTHDHDVSLPGYAFAGLRQLLPRLDHTLFAIAGRACQVAFFVRTHNFCSLCGDTLQEVTDELAVYCGHCNYRTYPRISPCIIVAVYRHWQGQPQLLLARGVRHPAGLYSVLAGFVESGESLEQCVHREVFEETQIKVKSLQYVTSQPWPFPHSLMAGFIAEYAGGELALDDQELVAGGWFNLDELPQTPPPGTIAARLIEVASNTLRLTPKAKP